MKEFEEIGAFKKSWKNRIKIALVYPNYYKIGMSSLGFQTIYRILNEKNYITCDRVFLPNNSDETPRSIEHSRPLSDFDFVLFSISYSADSINVFHILKKSNIPLTSSTRSKHHPILGAGGTAIFLNPEPLANVFDFFFLGEAENFIDKLDNLLINNPEAVKDNDVFLNNIRLLYGVYIPSDLQIRYSKTDKIENSFFKNDSKKISKIHIPNLNEFPTYSSLFSPNAEFGSLFMEEITRGCARGCRFCAIGFIGKPFRIRDSKSLKFNDIKSEFKVGLLGAAICDHPQINEIANKLISSGTDADPETYSFV